MTSITPSSILAAALARNKNSDEFTVTKHTITQATPESRALIAANNAADARAAGASKAAQAAAGIHELPGSKAVSQGASAENNQIIFANMTDMSREDAAGALKGVQYLIDHGYDIGKTISAQNGSQKTDSIETYKAWLQARAGIDVYA